MLVWITTATFSPREEIFQTEFSLHHPAAPDIALDHKSIPNIPILNTKHDTFRFVPFVHYHVAGHDMTNDNAEGLQQVSGSMN